MSPMIAQSTPFFLAVIVVGLGVIYSNLKLASIKDVIMEEGKATRAAIARLETAFRADVDRLEQRIDRLERGRVIHS